MLRELTQNYPYPIDNLCLIWGVNGSPLSFISFGKCYNNILLPSAKKEKKSSAVFDTLIHLCIQCDCQPLLDVMSCCMSAHLAQPYAMMALLLPASPGAVRIISL